MRSAGSYITSFIVTLLLVFTLIGSAGCITVENFADKDSLVTLTEEKNISAIAYKELNKFFTEQYAETGIPADVYMSNIDEEYLQSVINDKIDFGFTALNDGDISGFAGIPNNEKLENGITEFYKSYAENNGYIIKDENDPFYEKLALTKKKAYQAVEQYCDVFKFNALVKHGVIGKIKPIYNALSTITVACFGASAFLILLLLLCNFKGIRDSLYWIGTASLSAGTLGCIPCVYLLNTDFFASFTIKQAQIYTAYTSAMKNATEIFLTISITLIAVAVGFYIIYGILSAISKNAVLKK